MDRRRQASGTPEGWQKFGGSDEFTTRNPQPATRNPQPATRNPNPQPATRNPQPATFRLPPRQPCRANSNHLTAFGLRFMLRAA